jgi:hypothetical protein
MPLATLELFPSIAGFRDAISSAEIRAIAKNREVRMVQTSQPASPKTWDQLDAELFARRPDLKLRLVLTSGFDDLSFVATLKNVRHFAVDGIRDVKALASVARLPRLESLALGLYRLDTFDFLREVSPRHLHALSLGRTKSKKPSLAPLARFAKLRTLYLEGHHKDIEVLSGLRALEDVTLRSVTTPDLGYLRPLSKLRSLDVKLGGIKSLSAIAGMKSVAYLEVWRVKGLAEVDVAGQLPGLQYLFLQALPAVEQLPSFARSRALRRVHLQGMRGLRDVSSLARAPALEELVVYEGEGLDPDDFEPVLAKQSLARAVGLFGNRRQNERFVALAAKHGIGPVSGPYELR